jgi:cystathionine beta-lyase/cystathionine gamma-synthase
MKQLQTKGIHAGAPRPRIKGAITTPIFQSSNFEYHGEDYHDVGYLRLSNSPNHEIVGKRVAVLEEAESALITGSGMAAISGVLFGFHSAGDHVLVQDCLYGGTAGLFTKDLVRFGVEHTAIDPQDPDSWKAALKKNTKSIYVETLTNPLVQLADLKAVVEFARENGLLSIIDNTFASPINFRPVSHGFDLSLESCTKYMGGHSDLIAGSVSGSAQNVRKVKLMVDHLGGSLSALECFLLERGLKTLALRVKYHNESAGIIAEALSDHPAVSLVNYPGLRNHAQHARAKELLDGFGGMISFELKGGVDAAEALLEKVTIPAVAASLGGAESLMVRPAAAIHSGLTAEQRKKSGVNDWLIRFSVGLEGTDDLLTDITEALKSISR